MAFSEESLRDIEKRTRSHDLRCLRLTGLKKSKHALHDAANRDGPQWGEFVHSPSTELKGYEFV